MAYDFGRFFAFVRKKLYNAHAIRLLDDQKDSIKQYYDRGYSIDEVVELVATAPKVVTYEEE